MPLPFAALDYATHAEIEDLIHTHSWLLDHGRGEEITELYADDGIMAGVGPERIGRAGILEYARARKPGRIARHVCSNLRLRATDGDHVTGTFIMALYRSDDRPPLDATPIALADIDDQYIRCGDGRWRIARRQISISFEAEAHRAQQGVAAKTA